MAEKVVRADRRHLAEINRLIVEAKIGDPLEGLKPASYIVRRDGKVVAFASLDFVGNEAAILEDVVVERGYRHQRIASVLVDHCIAVARKRGIRRFALCTMYYLFRFFKRWGFITRPRKDLPDDLKNYEQFTVKRYMKCAVMVRGVA
ncbi:MAG: GNAT family N-acetyltransferase [Candidatus Harrisonbacteria bacterium]|nr:GNAT family N-acetyltransferase [Candidatus Harrisonbacteria bacterium]